MKRFFSLFLTLTLLFSLCACGKTQEELPAPAAEEIVSTPQPMAEAVASDPSSEGSVTVYAPETEECWTALGELYGAKTGIPVSLTDSPDKADLLCADYATVASRADSAADLGESAAYALLNVPAYAFQNTVGCVVGLPLSIEAVAVGVNTELLEKAGYTMERLDGFKALRRFSTSVNDRKEALGFSGWAPMALAEGSGQKLTRYLFDLPIYAELLETDGFTGKYVGDYRDYHYRDLFTTMLDLGTKKGKDVNKVTDEEALGVFARGEALFCLVDSRELDTLASLGMDLSKLDFVPAWMAMPGEADWGFVADATAYAAVVAKTPLQQHNAEDFLYWCLRDAEAQALLAQVYDGLPYGGFTSRNPLLQRNAENDQKGLTPVPWLHRRVADLDAWDSYFLSQLYTITPDNVVWRWQIMTWKLRDIWNGK